MADKNSVKEFRKTCEHDGLNYEIKLKEIEKEMMRKGCTGMAELKKRLEHDVDTTDDLSDVQHCFTVIEYIDSVTRIHGFIDHCDKNFGKKAAGVVWDKYILSMLADDIALKYHISKRWLFVILDRYINSYLDVKNTKEKTHD